MGDISEQCGAHKRIIVLVWYLATVPAVAAFIGGIIDLIVYRFITLFRLLFSSQFEY